MVKVRDIDIKKLSITKQDFALALKKTCRKIEPKKKEE